MSTGRQVGRPKFCPVESSSSEEVVNHLRIPTIVSPVSNNSLGRPLGNSDSDRLSRSESDLLKSYRESESVKIHISAEADFNNSKVFKTESDPIGRPVVSPEFPPVGLPPPLSLSDVVRAAARIQRWVQRTPVLTSAGLSKAAGAQLYFKAENFQKTGSFKARGATNAVLKLQEDTLKRGGPPIPGIVTHSSGNHGQAVAYAAKCAGLRCTVVVPHGTAEGKCQAIKGYGAKLVFCEATPTARKEAADDIAHATGYHLVHPYEDYTVMAGQGTIALELLEEVPDLDAILVPISGGGMTAGVAVAARSLRPYCKVFAVEPEGKGLGRCLKAKRRLWPEPPQSLPTIADAIRTQQVGERTFPILCSLVERRVFTVTDEQMVEGIKLAFHRLKVVVEAASGAAVYAAVHQLKQIDPGAKKVGVILCGGNIDFDTLALLPQALRPS